jgi:hypothetical protein
VVKLRHDDLVAFAELSRERARKGEVERGHVRAEHDFLRTAAEEARSNAACLADEQVAAPAPFEGAAEVRVRLTQVPGDRFDHLVGHLRPARRVEENRLAGKRGEPPSHCEGID